MCMVIYTDKKPQAKQATENMTVYKVVKRGALDGIFVTPYLHMAVEQNKQYSTLLTNPTMEKAWNKRMWSIHEGFHTFQNYDDAMYYAGMLSDIEEWECRDNADYYVVLEGYIPKGAKYYEGVTITYETKFPSFVSDTIVYTKEAD